MKPLSTQEAQFGQDLIDKGYVVVPGVVARSRLNELNRQIVDAYGRSVKFKGGGSISGHLNCFPGAQARFLYEEIEAYGIGDAIRDVFGDLPHNVRPTLNLNLPGSAPQHYHMDGVYTEEYIICNVAVVDTDLVNGAIDLLPSTHQQFYPFWRYAIHRKYRLSTRVPMAQGDVLVRRSTLWHRGMPNRSQEPRPMFSLTFGERNMLAQDPFTEGGDGIDFYPNWYPAGRLGAMRERMEVAVPLTRSSVRFARSLVRNRGYSSY